MIWKILTIVLVLSELGLAQVAIAPKFQQTQACVGTLKAYKSLTDTAVSFRAFQNSRRRIKPLPASTVLVAEGNCCWDVYSRPRYRARSTPILSVAGPQLVTHVVRSLHQVPCESTAPIAPRLYLASVNPVSLCVLLVCCLSLGLVFMVRRLRRSDEDREEAGEGLELQVIFRQ